MSKYPTIFSPGHIGKMTTKNRIVMAPMGTMLPTSHGALEADAIEYYRERAKGGTGLIVTEVAVVEDKTGRAGPCIIQANDADYIPGMLRLTKAVHQYGTKIFLQIYHAGNQASSFANHGNQTVSASDVQNAEWNDRPRALSTSEVKELVQQFAYAANIAKRGNFDGVEVHGAHGYLINQFLSPRTNKRTDEYGGSLGNRCRFAVEIVQEIKKTCGEDFPVSVRISVDEFIEGGYGLEEGVEICKIMEKAGADVIHASFGVGCSYPATIEPASFDQGWRLYMAEAVKKAVDIPVIGVGNLREPEFIEDALKEGKADFMAIGRGLIAEPDWCNKAQRGREKEMRKCISCMTCLESLLAPGPLSCAINARTGHEAQYPLPVKDGNKQKVVIVGAGPGGIEAALVSAKRNFDVVLFDENAEIGGQIQQANKPLHKYRFNWYIDYVKHELARLGVDIRLNTKADAETVKAEDPHAVFIATGGVPIVPQRIPGINSENVFTASDYLIGNLEFKDKSVVVIGGGMTGSETAALVGSRGNNVTLVEMREDFCIGIYLDSRIELVEDMKEYDVNILVNTRLDEIKESSVLVTDVISYEQKQIKADAVLLALGVRSVNHLYDELFDEYENIYLVGDAEKQGKIIDAVSKAHVFALELEA